MAYSFHYYGPQKFAMYEYHRGDFESKKAEEPNDKFENYTKRMKRSVSAVLARVARWQAANGGVRIYVGEFNASLAPQYLDNLPNNKRIDGQPLTGSTDVRLRAVTNFLRHMTNIFERNDWDWSLHAFRESWGWNIEANFKGENEQALWDSSTLKAKWAKNTRIAMQPALDIQIAASGKRLDADATNLSNGGGIQLWERNGWPNQQWWFQNQGDGTYTIWNLAAGRVLDAHAPDVNRNGCRVQLWDYNGQSNQRWRFEEKTDGTHRIVSVASGKVLDAHLPDVNNNGGKLQLWDDLSGANQSFAISLRI